MEKPASVIAPTVSARGHSNVIETLQNRGSIDFAAVANRVRDEMLLNYRRFVFDDFIRSIRFTPNEILVVREDGVFKILAALYYFVYQHLFTLDCSRNVHIDGLSLRYRTLRILNDCARGDYTSLFEMIYT